MVSTVLELNSFLTGDDDLERTKLLLSTAEDTEACRTSEDVVEDVVVASLAAVFLGPGDRSGLETVAVAVSLTVFVGLEVLEVFVTSEDGEALHTVTTSEVS